MKTMHFSLLVYQSILLKSESPMFQNCSYDLTCQASGTVRVLDRCSINPQSSMFPLNDPMFLWGINLLAV
jgi:hypothetical protein